MLINETGANLIRNDSWSGSTVGYTGYNGNDTSKTSSFICRLEKLAAQGFFAENKIDTVFVFGGTNDSWSDAPLGEYTDSVASEKELYNVLPAIGHFFKRLRQVLPSAKIYGICNCDIKKEIVSAIGQACRSIGGKSIELKQINKLNGHPTPLGMEQIKEQVLAVISEK